MSARPCPQLKASDLAKRYGFTARCGTMLDQHQAARLLGISGDRLRHLVQTNLVPPPDEMHATNAPYWHESSFKASTISLRRHGYIYFIQCEAFIKIGFATSTKLRLRTLQTSSPHPMTLLHSMQGTLAREQEIIDAFADIAHRGEWFHDTTVLRAYIDKLIHRGDRVADRIRSR